MSAFEIRIFVDREKVDLVDWGKVAYIDVMSDVRKLSNVFVLCPLASISTIFASVPGSGLRSSRSETKR
jgi:hypothetical protein